MVNAIARKDQQWPVRIQVARDQCAGNMSRRIQCICIYNLAPRPLRVAFCQKHGIRAKRSPAMQAVHHAGWVGRQWARRAHDHCAIAAMLKFDVYLPKPRTFWCLLQHRTLPSPQGAYLIPTFSAFLSKNARSRLLASVLLVAMVAINDSISKPILGSASAMRGRACMTAKVVKGALPAMRAASSSALASPSPAFTRYWENPS